MLPSLRKTVEKYGIINKRSLGQNFIFDLNLTDKIARSAGDLTDKIILEIGPGPGGLTRALFLNNAKTVIAIEQDKKCVEALGELHEIVGNRLKIISSDALIVNESNLFRESGIFEKVKIVANLPYNIATESLFKWLNTAELFESMTLMFQKEVAERILAKPGNKQYGRVSVMSQWLCEVRRKFDINPSAFYPPPKVTSTVISLIPRDKTLFSSDKKKLENLLKAVFGQRRKMMRTSLKQLCRNPEEILVKAGVNPESRPEDLTIVEFCSLAELVG